MQTGLLYSIVEHKVSRQISNSKSRSYELTNPKQYSQ